MVRTSQGEPNGGGRRTSEISGPIDHERRGPLDDIRVLDVSGALGALCARLLGDFGADVLKVEPPSGDKMRRRPPFLDGCSGPESSLLFAAYHVNKRGITLDSTSAEAVGLLTELAAVADVVIITPSIRSPMIGFDPQAGTVTWAPADSIVCVLTPFGMNGPLCDMRATPFTAFAMGGGMLRAGPPEGPPVAAPGQVHWDEASIHAALAVLAALEARPRFGGQLLDLSAHEVAASKDFVIERYDTEGMSVSPRIAGVGIPPTGTWMCRDGLLEIACHQTYHWDAFLAMLDYPDELSEPSLADPIMRRLVFDGLAEVIERLMADRSRVELFEKGQAAGLPCCPSYTPAEFVADPQANARGISVPMETGVGPVTIPWASCLSDPLLRSLRRPAPRLGEHNLEVYVEELNHAPEELAAWKATGLV